MARTDGTARGEVEFTQTIQSRDGRRQKSTEGTAREEAEFTQTIQSRDGRIQKSKRTIKNVMSMSMAGQISEEKSSFLSTHTSLIAVLYGGAAVVYSLSS